jgi:hypothetical protein
MSRAFWVLLGLLICQACQDLSAQSISHTNRGGEDLSQLKQLAERGSLRAEFILAEYSMSNHLFRDAFKWYSAAAQQGYVEARYQKGRLLLFGRRGATPDQSVTANPTAGLELIYQVATNRHRSACADLGRALKEGVGCTASSSSAYVWYALSSTNESDASHEVMNRLALRLSADEIKAALGQVRAAQQGHWPDSPVQVAGETDKPPVVIELKLSGLIFSPRGNLAVINGHTIAEGERCQFMTAKKDLVLVTCVQVEPGSAEVRVEGETHSRTLYPLAH